MKKLIFILIFPTVLLGCGKDGEELLPNFIDGKFVYSIGPVYTRNLNWTNPIELTADDISDGTYAPQYYSPQWSSDGSQILYIRDNRYNSYSIMKMDSNGDNKEQVLAFYYRIHTMDWSNDGQWIAYPNGDSVHIISVDGEEKKVIIVNDNPSIEFISWSSDSKKIALYDTGGNLIILDVESGEESLRKTNIWGMDFKPRWSPNDKYIVYNTSIEGTGQIVLLNITDNSETILQKPQGVIDIFGWTPDGEYIIYVSGTGKYRDFTALQVSNGQKKELIYKSDGWLDYPKGDLFIFQ
ncbi:hypothetical protein [Maribellus mangrovi]|uniref:hypothetical protein n=1 Tax=Maribellus mangrovi TaxID=3133146 RepID=UPI0030EC1739